MLPGQHAAAGSPSHGELQLEVHLRELRLEAPATGNPGNLECPAAFPCAEKPRLTERTG
jgi:hypothetical protein